MTWISYILNYSSLSDINNYRLVCKEWNNIIINDNTWNIYFINEFGSIKLIKQKKLLKCNKPYTYNWFFSCLKLKKIVLNKKIQNIIQTKEDKNDLSEAINVLLYLNICRAYINYPDNEYIQYYNNNNKFKYTYNEIINFIIRYNLPSIKLSKKQQRSTYMNRRLSNIELIISLSTIISRKLRIQLYILRERYEYICGEINAKNITLEFLQQYNSIFYIHNNKKNKNSNNIDNQWVLLRSEIRFIISDEKSLFNVVYNILHEHPNGIREKPFRLKFERYTGLPFGYCYNKSLQKYINKNCLDFQFIGSKLFLINN